MSKEKISYKKNNNDINTTSINIRCTNKVKDKLKKKADKLNIPLSEYVLNTSLAGVEKRSVKEHKRIVNLIHRTDVIRELNDIKNSSDKGKSVKISRNLLDRIIDMEEVLWES